MPGLIRVDDDPARTKVHPGIWKAWFRRGLVFLLGDYKYFRIYRHDLANLPEVDLSSFLAQGYEFREVKASDLASAADPDVRSRACYCGDDALSFAVYHHGEVVCAQWFWFGERYRRRNFWPLDARQAKSIELFTVARHRGNGLATALKIYSAKCMKEKGFDLLFSRIWHSHQTSRRVSEKAGWKHIAVVMEFTPLGLGKTVRLIHKRKAGPSRPDPGVARSNVNRVSRNSNHYG